MSFEDYKKIVIEDCEDSLYSDKYISRLLDLHETPFNLKDDSDITTKKELKRNVILQLNLLSTVQINKCLLYNFLCYCYKNKDSQIYLLERKRYITKITTKRKNKK